jgi:hypothetical protein
MALTPTACDQCGQSDDHPKLHYGIETYHHDCIPARVRRDLGDDPIVPQIIEAAESGTRGAALRSHIESLHSDSKNDEE